MRRQDLDTTKHRVFLFSYYGGKSKIARYYPAPRYDTIIEPFAGAANYSCSYFNRNVILYEANPTIFGILEFLIKSGRQEILKLPLLGKDDVISDLKVCQEARDLVGMRICMGAARPQSKITPWAGSDGDYCWSKQTRYELSEFVEKIKHWKLRKGDCWDAFDRRFRQAATWFIDPPYQGKAGTHYVCGSGDIDYSRLGVCCRSLEGQAIVCEREGAEWLPFRVPDASPKLKHINSLKGQKHKLSEVIWTNEPPAKGFGL